MTQDQNIVERLEQAAVMRDELKERYWNRASGLKREAAEIIRQQAARITELERRLADQPERGEVGGATMVERFRFHTLDGSSPIQMNVDETFVRHSDYEALQSENAALRAERDDAKAALAYLKGEFSAMCARAEATEAALAKAREALHFYARLRFG